MTAEPSSAREQPDGTVSLFVRVGGPDVLRAVVSLFYDRVLADPELSGFFDGVDMTRLRSHQRWFLAAALGGPDLFTGRDLGAAHAGLGVTDDAFDRVVAHLATTLDDLGATAVDVAEVRATVEGLRPVVVTASNVPPSPISDLGT